MGEGLWYPPLRDKSAQGCGTHVAGKLAFYGGRVGHPPLMKKEFFSADIAGGSISDKPIPKWVGRAVFIVVGVLLIVGGIAALLSDH